MACGDRYAYLAVTASGLNFENPHDHVPTSSDYEEWRELARRLNLLAQTFTDALGVAEEAATPGSFPHWNAANEVRTRAVEAYDDLPSPWLAFNLTEAIGQAQASVADALCTIEIANDSIVLLGGVPPPLPIAPPKRDPPPLIPKIPSWVWPVGIGLAGLYLYGRLRR